MSKFHELDNPNLSQDNKPYLFEISTNSISGGEDECNRFRLYEENLGRFLDIPGRYTGVGIINEIDINYIDRSFTFRGEV
jgi:hypothetical protein